MWHRSAHAPHALHRPAALLAATLALAGCRVVEEWTGSPPPRVEAALDDIAAWMAPALTGRGGRLAVAPFSLGDGDITPYSHRLAESMTVRLAALPGVRTVERARIDYLLDELEFQHSALADEGSSEDLGKVVGADVVVVGSYHVEAEAVIINARAVDVATHEILAVAEARARFEPEVASASLPPPPPETDLRGSVAVDLLVLAERFQGGLWSPLTVTDGTVLYSEDQFQVHVTPRQDCHLYLLLGGSSGRMVRLFPPAGTEALVRSGTPVQVPPPGPTPWFGLDATPGTEKLYLVAWLPQFEAGEGLSEALRRVAGWDAAMEDPLLSTTLERLSTEIEERVAFRRRAHEAAGRPGPAAAGPVDVSLSGGEAHRLVPAALEGTAVLVRTLRIAHR